MNANDMITRPGYLWCERCQAWVSTPLSECPECGSNELTEEGEMEDQE